MSAVVIKASLFFLVCRVSLINRSSSTQLWCTLPKKRKKIFSVCSPFNKWLIKDSVPGIGDKKLVLSNSSGFSWEWMGGWSTVLTTQKRQQQGALTTGRKRSFHFPEMAGGVTSVLPRTSWEEWDHRKERQEVKRLGWDQSGGHGGPWPVIVLFQFLSEEGLAHP